MNDMPEMIWAANYIDQQGWSPFNDLIGATAYRRADLPPQVKPLVEAATAVIARWDSVDWKAPPTAGVMNDLRVALAAMVTP
jgi:hypothetical protein